MRPPLRMLNRIDGPNVTAAQIRAEIPPELSKPITDEELLAGYRDIFGIQVETDAAERVDHNAADEDADNLTGNDEWRYLGCVKDLWTVPRVVDQAAVAARRWSVRACAGVR